MEKTNKPTVAGILAIISGVFGLIGAVSMFIGFGVVSGALGIPTGYIPAFVPGIILGIAIPSTIIAILALVGGIYAVQRKMWGLALAGSIAAILAFLPLGIAAVILTAQSRNEFEQA
ncbi:MAG: hypothetical protein ACETVS_01910 [Dehalococcoidales bacterium]